MHIQEQVFRALHRTVGKSDVVPYLEKEFGLSNAQLLRVVEELKATYPTMVASLNDLDGGHPALVEVQLIRPTGRCPRCGNDKFSILGDASDQTGAAHLVADGGRTPVFASKYVQCSECNCKYTKSIRTN